MIKLGSIIIKDETSFAEVRNKIYLLSNDLGFKSISAAKLSIISSELVRIIYKRNEKTSVLIELDKKKELFGLKIIFQSRKKEISVKKASIFFDDFFISKDKDGYVSINTFKYIPDSKFKPTEKFINLEKQKLIRLSKADLLRELQGKYKEIKKIKDQYKYLSFHDSLTGLYSRTYFENEMERLNSDFGRFKPLTIVMIDINGLKKINDNLGHAKGDLLIKEVAKIIKSFIRKSDMLARVGGDEFCAIFPNTKYDIVFARRKAIEKEIAKYNNNSSNELKISIATGISTSSIQDNGNIYDLYKESDSLMYEDKQKKYKRLNSISNLKKIN